MYKLREIQKSDIAKINEWHNDYALSQKLGGGYRYCNEEVDLVWYERYLQSRGNNVRCAVVDESNEILGCVYLLNINQINLSAELHIMIGDSENRGKGIGSFAIEEIIHHAFCNLNLRRLQLEVLVNNEQAINLYTKYGFKQEGIARKAVYKNGEYLDVILMGLLREEYKK